MQKPKLIYIGGYGRSGSTIMDTLLSNCKDVWGLGEASNLFQCLEKSEKCSCGQEINECAVWCPFVNGRDWDVLDRQQRQAESLFRIGGIDKYYDYCNFWRSVAEDAAKNGITIVDSSKVSRMTFYRAFNLRRLGFDVQMVYLHRDSEGLLSSLIKGSNKELAGAEKKTSKTKFLLRSFFGALAANSLTLLASKVMGGGVFVNYSDLIHDPISVLRKVGVCPNDEFALTALSPGHGVSGNRLRIPGEKIAFKQRESKEKVEVSFFFKKLFLILDLYDKKNY